MACNKFIRRFLTKVKPTVAVGMSGGVDSSVAALLLLKQGFDVRGFHMQNWDPSDEEGYSVCPIDKDFCDTEEVCRQLGIPLSKVDLVKPYWNNVFTPFLEGYRNGATPNPDVLCNREIKFDAFLKHIESKGGGTDFVATGHYARLSPNVIQLSEGVDREPIVERRLLTGVDINKDQSYFLSLVPIERFWNVLFPLGDLEKSEVREIALQAGLVTAQKKESMGICFIGKRKFDSFLSNYLENDDGYQDASGKFYDIDTGKEIGEHQGLPYYTIGQGARISGEKEKWFVVKKDNFSNNITVCKGTNHPALFTHYLDCKFSDFNWLSKMPLKKKFSCTYKARYRQPHRECTVEILESSSNDSNIDNVNTNQIMRVYFDQPERGIAEQQTLVLYDGDMCLGGGAILRSGVNNNYNSSGIKSLEDLDSICKVAVA